MATNEFNISIDLREAETFFAKLASRIQNQVPFRQAVAKLIADYIEKSFAGEQTPSGAPWADLKPYTIRMRQAKGLVPIVKLQATKKGKRSIKVVPTSTGFRVEAMDYMDDHNKGKPNMAARRWMPTEQEMTSGAIAKDIKAIQEAYLTQGLKGFVQGEISRTPDFVRNLLGL